MWPQTLRAMENSESIFLLPKKVFYWICAIALTLGIVYSVRGNYFAVAGAGPIKGLFSVLGNIAMAFAGLYIVYFIFYAISLPPSEPLESEPEPED